MKDALDKKQTKYNELTTAFASFSQSSNSISKETFSESTTNKMDNLVKKWKQLVTTTEAFAGGLNEDTIKEIPNEAPQRPGKLNMDSVKIISESFNIDLRTSETSSDETGSPDSPGSASNIANYQITQSSSKVFTAKSASNSFTSQVNIILTKEAQSPVTESADLNEPSKSIATDTTQEDIHSNESFGGLEKSLRASLTNETIRNVNEEFENVVDSVEAVEIAESAEILKIIQKHSASGEFDKLIPSDNGVKIVTLTEDSGSNAPVVCVADTVFQDEIERGHFELEEENFEMISNNLFDWLLWIDHTIKSQVNTRITDN